jgi:hypothetical protein
MEDLDLEDIGRVKKISSPCLTETVKWVASMLGAIIVATWVVATIFTQQKDIPARVEKLEADVSIVKSDLVGIRTKTDMIYDIVSRRK